MVQNYIVNNPDKSTSFIKVCPDAHRIPNTFYVEVILSMDNEDGTQRVKIINRDIPLEKYNDFINDLKSKL